ncbi:response regulator transcription factor [Oscillospiraceae bacterium HV4-5-C5C]|nr:response regulator transcription factor [Oscillospiraceae bacterium HV4-5-C5C]
MLTLGYADLGQKQAAAMHLARALELAQAADLRLPFISYDARLAAFAPASLYKEIQLWLKPPITSQTPPAAAGINQLTAREREIARLAGLGLRNKEIAQQLYISQGTVRNHLNEVFQKLGIDRRGSLKDYLDQL